MGRLSGMEVYNDHLPARLADREAGSTGAQRASANSDHEFVSVELSGMLPPGWAG